MQLGARWQSTLEYREDVPQFRVGPMMKTTRIADQGRTPSRKFPLQPPQPSRIDFLTPGGASRSSDCYSRFDHFAKRQLASKAPPLRVERTMEPDQAPSIPIAAANAV